MYEGKLCTEWVHTLQLKECYAPAFWQRSKGLFHQLGYAGEPRSLQGLMRVWDLPGAGGSRLHTASGVAQWLIDNGAPTSSQRMMHSSLFHTRPHSIPNPPPSATEDMWSCSRILPTYITDSAGMFALPNFGYAEDFAETWVFSPSNASIEVLEIRFHVV